jgi:hypothetical protein
MTGGARRREERDLGGGGGRGDWAGHVPKVGARGGGGGARWAAAKSAHDARGGEGASRLGRPASWAARAKGGDGWAKRGGEGGERKEFFFLFLYLFSI